MRELNLSHIVSAFSTYTSTLNSLWGLFIVATFSAAGFGASMKSGLSPTVAACLALAFIAFAGAHLRVVVVTTRKLAVIAEEVRERQQHDPERFTDYPRSVAAIVHTSFSLPVMCTVHLVVDGCVLAIIWMSTS